jgi:hypothetical protein
LAEYSASVSEMDSADKMSEFLGRRLRDINGMVFFDYAAKYKIEMPDIRDALPKSQEPEKKQPVKSSNPLLPPDKGDVFDKIYACEQATKLAQKCKLANVSLGSSPWLKYGGYPTPLSDFPKLPAGATFDPTPRICGIAAEWQNYCKVKVK